MIESAWLFIGVVALLVTGATVVTPDDGWAIVLGVAGFIAWGVFAYASLDVTVVAESTTHNFQMPIVTLFGVTMSLIPGYIALTGPADLIMRYQDPDIREM